MAKLTLRTPWTSQPQTPVGANGGAPLKPDWLWNLNRVKAIDAVRGIWTVQGGVAAVASRATPNGIGLYNTATNSHLELLPGSVGIGTADYWVSFTFTWAANVSSGSSINVIGGYGTGWGNAGLYFYSSGAGSNVLVCSMDTTATTVSSGTLIPGKQYTVLGYSKGSTATFYLNGRLLGTATKATPTETSDTRLVATADRSASNALRRYPGSVHAASMGIGTISDGAAAWATANPWQLFAPLSRTIWVPAAAGGTNTYTLAVSGGFSLGGTAQYNRVRNSQVSAGISFAGSSPLGRTRVAQISGGVTFGGSAPITFVPFSGSTYTLAVSGGFSLGGTAPYNRVRVAQVSAGVNFGGTAQYSKIRVSQISGGVTFGGTNSIIFIPAGGAINIPQRTIVGAGT